MFVFCKIRKKFLLQVQLFSSSIAEHTVIQECWMCTDGGVKEMDDETAASNTETLLGAEHLMLM